MGRKMRSSRLSAVLSIGAVLSLVMVLAGSATAHPLSAASSHGRADLTTTKYAVARNACAAARPGHLTCYAMRLERATRNTPGAQPLVATPAGFPRGPSGVGLTPADLATAYGYNRFAAVHQTVAIVDAYDDPKAAADLAGFEANYHIAKPGRFVKVGQGGSPNHLPRADRTGWSVEESLDIDTVRAVCATCTILLVEAKTARSKDLSKAAATAVRMGANEVSNSYGGPEKGNRMKKKAAARYRHRGVVFTASTGDEGWYGWGTETTSGRSQSSPSQPATLPGVVAVGGTRLALTASAHRARETVWNNFGPQDRFNPQHGASGGGCSLITRAPVWQRHVAHYGRTGCGKKRLAADISAEADPHTGLDVHDTFYCGPSCGPSPMPAWQSLGGTSLSSPLIAAMWALAGGARGIRHPAATLYKRFATKSHGHVYDVRHGGNGFCDTWKPKACQHGRNGRFAVNAPHRYGLLSCTFARNTKNKPVKHHTQCVATKGYDGPSGIGTPMGLKVFTPVKHKHKHHHPKH
jgi:subtilase family serine protease